MSVMPSGNNRSRIIVLSDDIKHLDLSEEEQEAFRKAKSQVLTHSRLGALAGALAGGYFSRLKKYTLGLSLTLCVGSMVMGGQIGFFTGTAAGIRTIKSLPNSQRIFEAIKNAHFQNIPQNRKQSQNQEQGGDEESSALSDEFIPDNRDLGDTGDEQQSSWNYGSPPRQHQQQSSSQHDDNNSSSWDKIRAKNSSSSSTWDKIRQNNNSAQQQQKPTFNNDDSNESIPPRTRGDFENIPRTREDFEELRNEGKIRTNQYGDIEIIN
ncbi:hypothetical protein RclHR1_03630004 [Rhizophagus clarus]|uniref:Uncharacterized protein n=1 Tax=Rhizophagus clarus TaxID=94130 RepID=A0A2Z6S6D1_9GLOM|nr:hypothetical protein RclHR1_03630004 [Rhizophagus clarus]GES81445.1 hypothetical protein GLOIN_2v1480352 [Rhizophagus clarus]